MEEKHCITLKRRGKRAFLSSAVIGGWLSLYYVAAISSIGAIFSVPLVCSLYIGALYALNKSLTRSLELGDKTLTRNILIIATFLEVILVNPVLWSYDDSGPWASHYEPSILIVLVVLVVVVLSIYGWRSLIKGIALESMDRLTWGSVIFKKDKPGDIDG